MNIIKWIKEWFNHHDNMNHHFWLNVNTCRYCKKRMKQAEREVREDAILEAKINESKAEWYKENGYK